MVETTDEATMNMMQLKYVPAEASNTPLHRVRAPGKRENNTQKENERTKKKKKNKMYKKKGKLIYVSVV